MSAERMKINRNDSVILRQLAERIAELAARPVEDEKRELWYRHNALEPTRPLIFCDPENGWNEIITGDTLQCEGFLAREWEKILRKDIFWGEEMKDDCVIEPYFNVPYLFDESDWGMHETRIGGEDGGSYVWDSPLKSYEDMDKLHFPVITVDYKGTDTLVSIAHDIFEGILTVKGYHHQTHKVFQEELSGNWWWSLGMTWTLANIRGLEQIMYDCYDHPDELHRLVGILRDGTLAKLEFFESNGLLRLNNDGTYVGSGGFGWTTDLPQKDFDGMKVRACDMWGFAESQETSTWSPEMFAEFIFPYQLSILERFGLNCYGCCEPLDTRWEVIKNIPRLRRVSVSPWSNLQEMADKLEDRYIYSMKPTPVDLAVSVMDEDSVRSKLRMAMKITRNCRVEIIMKDNETIGNNPRNVINWCRIAREEADAL